jgi:alcohol dehydrogenase
MQGAIYRKFKGPVTIEELPDPTPMPDGVVIEVKATGICRSDWHGWMGHDTDITLPHVPGHELAGEVVEIGQNVKHWKKGDCVTVPFVGGCGHCPQCHSGNHQVCDHQFQPGFTHWGSFAEYVAINNADINLVRLPEYMSYEVAAGLGCRFITSYRGIVHQGKVSGGQWVAIHACGGVGLSAIMIANALGANVVAIDVDDEKLELAKSVGALFTINAKKADNVVEAVREITNGGAHVSMDALGHPETSFNSIANLRKRGKHIQVGIMTKEHQYPKIPMGKVISDELEIIGSHGMQAHEYPGMLEMIKTGKLQPGKLIGKKISLEEAPEVLVNMNMFENTGVTIINQF